MGLIRIIPGEYGVIAMDVYKDKATGKKMAGCVQAIPYRPTHKTWNSWIEKHNNILKCTINSSYRKFYTYLGREVTWPKGNGGKAVLGELPEAVKNFDGYKEW